MRKPALYIYGVMFLSISALTMTGCDLLGFGQKKNDDTKKTVSSPDGSSLNSQNNLPTEKSSKGLLPPNALVRIGDWTLTQEDFNNRINLLKQQLPDFKSTDPNAKGAVLDELIRQELLVHEAEDSGIGNNKEIKDAIEDFRKTLLVQEIASHLTKEVLATEEDARTFYGNNKDKFTSPTTWAVREIVVNDQATAKSILVQILQGANFAQIAQTQSKVSNAVEGGKIKPFITGKAPFDAMQTAISNLEEGGVSGVFKGPEGYYIVKVDSKTGGEIRSFQDVKKDLIYGLTMQKQQAVIFKHLKELAEKNKPEYNKDLIEQVIGKIGQ